MHIFLIRLWLLVDAFAKPLLYIDFNYWLVLCFCLQVLTHSDQSDPSSVSPSSVSSLGPPLKLRFAMEAGHYTLMEHQENQAAEQRIEQVSPIEASEEQVGS